MPCFSHDLPHAATDNRNYTKLRMLWSGALNVDGLLGLAGSSGQQDQW